MQEQRITQADVVDHIKPIGSYWDLRLRLENLRSLCHSHHTKKTAEDRRRYGGRSKICRRLFIDRLAPSHEFFRFLRFFLKKGEPSWQEDMQNRLLCIWQRATRID
ncbi:HNH endonuclease [Brevibacillus fortis]|uniref:HNH endonuclease n=1 Tax=Brevibacillus fortis TaxID=2126352 RepID=UPI002E1DD09A